MSALRLPNGDDHPEAAHKHLLDAGVLLAQQRLDGAAYLSGYVVECALKSLYTLETGKALTGHYFSNLLPQLSAVATVAGSKSAKYLGPATSSVLGSAISNWRPEMRYWSPSIAPGDAHIWYGQALDIFQETVHQMKLDGVL